MNNFVANLWAFVERLTVQQRFALSVVMIGGLFLLGGIAYWAGRPDYALLFSNLNATDANQIVETLKAQRISYQLREDGTAVFVPREQVYDLRINLASEGKITDGVNGYELFDRNTLGMTDFMQKLNFKRALEGELARTISNIRQVEMCRVHLVIPERSPFRQAQNQPSASVIVNLRSGTLTTSQIEGITSLVAGAVEGLSPADVTILDNRGNMLSEPGTGDDGIQASTAQIRMQRELEAHLTERGQSMLDQVLGSGNAVIRVSASLDFSRAISERELIDPESATVISEERLEEEIESGNASSMVRNFEMSRTRERSEKNVGDVSYLTVSVIVNYKRDRDGEFANIADDPPAYVQFEPEELADIESLVKNAVGFNEQRGDNFTIRQTRFDTSMDDRLFAELSVHHQREQAYIYIRYGILLLGILLAFWLLRSVYNRLASSGGVLDGALLELASKQQQGIAAAGQRQIGRGSSQGRQDFAPSDDVYLKKLSAEAQQKLHAKNAMFEEIQETVTESPETAANLIKSWLYEDTKEHGQLRP